MLCRSCIPKVPASTRTRALATSALRLVHTHALRHSSLLTHSRPSSRSQAGPSSQARGALHTRASFSTTAQRRAEELPGESLQAVFDQQHKVLKLLQDKPELLEDIQQFVRLLKDNGVDVSSGLMPSKMEMFRVLMKAEIRDTAMKMATAFQEAGIDLRSQELMKSLVEMQKQFKPKDK